MICTFFGHRQFYKGKEIEPVLRSVLVDLIESRNVTTFYVGNQGKFDSLVQRVLRELSSQYSISCLIVLAYLPGEKKTEQEPYKLSTLLPEGIEAVPKRFAIDYRNKWMVERSDYVITYVTHDLGSDAAKFKTLAEKRGKAVIELS